jgi:hypothetical protein
MRFSACLVGYDTVSSVERQAVFQRNITSIFRVKERGKHCFSHEDGGDVR